jgi:DNA-binding PadR family transcriptional regulator
MKHRTVSNPLALVVLAWLTTGPMHPYELARRLGGSGKDRSVKFNRGTLYTVVRQLVKAGFIEPREVVRDTQRPERTVYGLTEAGRTELREWLHESVAVPQAEYPFFGVALSLLGAIPPEEAVDLLARRSAALTNEIAATRALVEDAQKQGLHWVFLAEEEYRARILKTEQEYVDQLRPALADPEYAAAWRKAVGGTESNTAQTGS